MKTTRMLRLATLGIAIPLATAQAYFEERNLRNISSLINEIADHQRVRPGDSESQRGHARRTGEYLESKLVEVLTAQTFVPVPNVEESLRDLESINNEARRVVSNSTHREIENILVDVVSKDALSEAAQKSQRQVEGLLEDLAQREEREWSASSAKKQALQSSVEAVGQLLHARGTADLCLKSSDVILSEAIRLENQANDSFVKAAARRVYQSIASELRSELRRREDGVDAPTVCLPQLAVREVLSRQNVDPTLGVYVRSGSEKEIESDIFGTEAEEVIATLDRGTSGYVSVRQIGRGRHLIQASRVLGRGIAVALRLTAVNRSRVPVAETVINVALGGELARTHAPELPRESDVQVIGDRGRGSFVVDPRSSVELAKGQTLMLSGAILDQYGLVMGQANANVTVVQDADRVQITPSRLGASVFAKNVSDHPTRTVLEVDINSLAKQGARTTVNVKTVFASFGGFGVQEAQALVERLYRGILFRGADPTGLAGYARVIQREGLKGLKSAASDIASSPEFVSNILNQKSAEQIAENFYREILGRQADPGGLSGVVSEIRRGRAKEAAAGLVSSTEFRNNIIGR